LQGIDDRVLHRGIQQIVQPLLDPSFSSLSFGGRPQRGVPDALAHAEVLAQSDGRLTWIVGDIKDAFDRVPLNRLLDVAEKRLPNEKLVRFIGQQIQNKNGRGLRQGAPSSPLLLNLFLDHFLDRPWRQRHADVPLIRYVDDILLLCRADDDVGALYDELAQMLIAAGLPLKGSRAESIHDLAAGETVTWLGFDIRHGQLGLQMRLPTDGDDQLWLGQLRESFALAHEKTHSPLRALQAVDGLLDAAGPAYPFTDRRSFYEILAATMEAFAFEERPTGKECMRRWRHAYQRSCARRMAVARAMPRPQQQVAATTFSAA